MAGYAICGAILLLLFSKLTKDFEVYPGTDSEIKIPARFNFGLSRSKGIVFKLSGLFAVDAFARGFILQSMMAFTLPCTAYA